jgi:hypothetical protein
MTIFSLRTLGRTSRAKQFGAMALLFGGGAICGGQSHDPGNPTPLGPGVNKSNVDNKANGPNYYYFYAGPGHVDMHYAFMAMGVFGNPLRQSLNFDLYDENDKLITHDAIVSVENMEKLSRPGDLGSRHKLVIRVISPDTALRLGGYYEIEVTGAAAFDGKPTGANVKPEDTELYHPAGPLAAPQGSLYSPGVSLYTPVGALTNVQESPRELRLTLAADILFDFDKSTIHPDAGRRSAGWRRSSDQRARAWSGSRASRTRGARRITTCAWRTHARNRCGTG